MKLPNSSVGRVWSYPKVLNNAVSRFREVLARLYLFSTIFVSYSNYDCSRFEEVILSMQYSIKNLSAGVQFYNKQVQHSLLSDIIRTSWATLSLALTKN